jgi:hypothetical protein
MSKSIGVGLVGYKFMGKSILMPTAKSNTSSPIVPSPPK